jgi:type IV secretion system protein VirD4
VLIVGGSGSGKTWGFFLPNAAQAAGSFVATDPKGELWQHTSGYHGRAWRFAPREPDASCAFNWIPLCREEYVARLLAAAVLQVDEDPHEQQFWKLAELQLCAALFGFAAHSTIPTPATAYHLLQLGPTGLLETLGKSQSTTARTCAALLADQKAEARAGIVLGVANKLAFLEDPVVRRFTSADLKAPDFGELAAEPVAAYWVLHEQDAALLQPLSALFFTLLLDQLSRCDPGVVPITLFLDELANIGRIPHFPTIISVARGRGLSLVLGVQALSQLDGLYGRAGAETIRTNCATKVVLHGLDYQSAEEVSRALGETTVREELASRRPGDNFFTSEVTHSEHHSPRRLLTADEVRRIGDDQALLIISNLPPILSRRQHWDWPPSAARTAGLGREQAAPLPDPARATTGRLPANITHLRAKLRELEEE